MEERNYTITLADGTTISNLKLNGNNFISQTEVTSDMFEDNLSAVEIFDGETTTRMYNARLIQIARCNNEYWFIIDEIPQSELVNMQLQANIEYLSMMVDVEL